MSIVENIVTKKLISNFSIAGCQSFKSRLVQLRKCLYVGRSWEDTRCNKAPFYLKRLFIIMTGTDEERGIYSWRQKESTDTEYAAGKDIYEFPYVMKYIRRIKCCSYVPISPTFHMELKSLACNCCKNTQSADTNQTDQFDSTTTRIPEKEAAKGFYENSGIVTDWILP